MNIGASKENSLLKEVLGKAHEFAVKNKNEYVTVEHVLYVLIDYPEVKNIFEVFNIDKNNIKNDLEEYIKTKIPIINNKSNPIESISLVRVFTYAMYISEQTLKEVNSVILFASICSFKDSQAYYCLSKYGFDEKKISNSISEIGADSKNAYLINMNLLAKNGEYDKLIGREKELGQLMQTLAKVKRKNVILVSEPGVGKSALVEGFAQAVINNQVPDYLKDIEIYHLNIPMIIANTKMRGELEERINSIINEIIEKKAILFIDELHSIVESGGKNNPMDVSELLKPCLTNGKIKCIATTTYDDYKNIAKDRAFMRRFQKIELLEPSIEDATKILQGIIPSFETHYKTKYDSECILTAINLTQKYITDKFLPDKAIDLLDEVGADNLKNRMNKVIRSEDVERVLSNMLRIPLEKVTKDDLCVIKKLNDNLKSKIYGQDDAIDEVVNAIKLSKAGLTAKNKPIFSGLFCGGTGVGKTELVKQLATNLGVSLIRVDMSEYSEKHSVAKLIGSPPGYVGYEQGGMLIDSVIKNPNAVILLDEIEKADHSVYNVLLQIMDYGFLTENAGRKADFRHCILIMTTNAGSYEISSGKTMIGFGQSDIKIPISEIEKRFSPEFRNRLDKLIYFNPITKELMLKIVDKFLMEFNDIVKEKNISIILTDNAREYIADKSLDEKLGARPVNKYFTKIKTMLVDEILFMNETEKKIKIDVVKDELIYKKMKK